MTLESAEKAAPEVPAAPEPGTGATADTDPTAGTGVPAQTPAELAAAIRAVGAGEAAAPDRSEALRATAEVLAAGGAPAQLLDATVAALGEGAPKLLREDPWAILGVPGVRPEHADGFARGLLGADCGPDDPRRAEALTGWLLEQAAVHGHTAVELPTISAGLEKQGVPDAAAALAAVLGEGRVMAFQEEEPEEGGHRAQADEEEEPPTRVLLALDRLALAEESLADGLVRLLSTFEGDPRPTADDTSADDAASADDTSADDATDSTDSTDAEGAAESDAAPLDWAGAAGAAPSASAAALIRAVTGSGLVLHTGGQAARAEPVALVRAARELGLRACVGAATEDGRRRLGDESATTVAGLLSGTEGPGRAPDGSLALDLLVVCDASALDTETAATLVESVADGARLVLSGDPAELWSAGPGRVFADLLAARICPVVASRTPDFGPIGELVSGIGIGELLPAEAPDKEVVIITARDAEETAHRALQLVRDSIPRALGIPAEQVRVLTPGHGGAAGTRALNVALKQQLNPGPGAFGGYDPGDQVVHSPAPGVSRPATVRAGGPEGLVLDCEGRELRVPRDQVGGTLRHGWALTAHQAAGRRWPGVVVLLPPEAAADLTRQWVYSAFNRAERHLSVVHAVGPALAQAVTAVPARPRTTRLRGILAEQAADLPD
ncbi:AAA family ATPase [Streptacidiphilus sp. P02-A3a]|uniref:AAA family ATPase n=1 Tax=Streptacidiphilus sp. P02-A3a TaxID=2704468 RepID=UPI0015FA91AE|nr:AAA family ATPase [Streptacidiphilus sp. P02-A3a]QMU69305.1 AAA family ATPase [Streptacidiphilus sp. P02-A3a]